MSTVSEPAPRSGPGQSGETRFVEAAAACADKARTAPAHEPLKLLTGKDAEREAYRIAREAWQPSAGQRAGYWDLERTLNTDRQVIATYGELIFTTDKATAANPELLRQKTRDVREAVALLQSAPTGRLLLTETANAAGLPTLIDINDRMRNGTLTAESMTPDPSTGPGFNYNFNYMNWDSNTAFKGDKPGAGTLPAAGVLGHELFHIYQYDIVRAREISPEWPEGRLDTRRFPGQDQDRDGISDEEPGALALENILMQQWGLTPARDVYTDPMSPIETAGSTATEPLVPQAPDQNR